MALNVTVGSNPFGIAFDPANQMAYVSNNGCGTVSILNESTNQILSSTSSTTSTSSSTSSTTSTSSSTLSKITISSTPSLEISLVFIALFSVVISRKINKSHK